MSASGLGASTQANVKHVMLVSLNIIAVSHRQTTSVIAVKYRLAQPASMILWIARSRVDEHLAPITGTEPTTHDASGMTSALNDRPSDSLGCLNGRDQCYSVGDSFAALVC